MEQPPIPSPVAETTTETFIATFRVVDRGKDADAVRDLILGAPQRLIVLYGKSRSGKTEFVQNWLIPRLRAAVPGTGVFYGKCEPDLPRELEALDGTVSLDEAVSRPSIIVVDRFDRFLAQPREERREATERAFARFHGEGRHVKVVLVTDSSQLSNAYALSAYDPDLIGAVFEIPAVTVPQGLVSLSRSEGREELSYAKDALGQISAETRAIEKQGWEVSFDFIQFLDRRMRSYAAEHSKRVINRADLRTLGGLTGILREHLTARIERSPFDTEAEREILQAILESLVDAAQYGRLWKAEDLTARLGITGTEIDAVLRWLQTGDGVLTQGPDGAFEFAPPQLGVVVQEESESRRLTLDRVRRIVNEGVRSWERLGSLLSLSRFAEAHRARRFLVLDETSVRFLLLCALRYDTADTPSPAVYWLARIGDRVDAMDILLAAVFDDDARVRTRAAELLREFPEPEVYERLYIVALVDAEAAVRGAAVNSLGAMKDGDAEPQKRLLAEVQMRLLEEAKNPESPHRAQAIDALRVCATGEITGELQRLVHDPDTDVSLRERAIQVLAALDMPEAIDALLDIALRDKDADDRTAAAAALTVTRDENLARRILTQVGGIQRVRQVWSYILSGAWLLLAVITFAVMVTSWSDESVGFVFLIGLAAPIPTGWLLRRIRDGKIERRSPKGILAGLLFAWCAATVFYLFHGLAHLSIGRWRRASVLLALEVVSLLLVNAGTTFTEVLDGGLSMFYFGSGLLLFAATYVYDVGAVLAQTLLLTTKNQLLQRRTLVYQQVFSNPVAARLVFADLASADERAVSRSQALLKAFGRHVPSEQLIEYLQAGDRAQVNAAARALAVSKGDETVRRLEALWQESDQRRRVVINGILCGRPTQASLQALQRLWKDMTASMRARVNVARWNFRMAVWPAWARILVLAALPVVGYFAYNGFQASTNPAWSQLVMLRRAIHESPLPRLVTFDADGQSADRMIRLIGFLAENHPAQAGGEFLSHLTRRGDGRHLDRNLRAALAGGLLVIAVAPNHDVPADLMERVRGADSAAFAALFLGDTGAMPATLDRLGRYSKDGAHVTSAVVGLLSRLVLSRVPDPDSIYLAEAGYAVFTEPDTVARQRARDSLRLRAERWKIAAVRTIGQFEFDVALPALDSLLQQRSASPALARALRDNMEAVTSRAFGNIWSAADPLSAAQRLLATLDALQSKPEMTAAVRRQVASLEAQAVETSEVIQDPDAEEGYRHALEKYEENGRYRDAVTLFAQFKTRYPGSIWPRKILSELHHEYLALTEEASFMTSYREMRELLESREFEALRVQDTATAIRIEADYQEIALSANDFEAVEQLAGPLTVRGREPVYRYNGALMVYFARVIARNLPLATDALNELERIVKELPPDYYNNWRYPGTVAYLRRSGLPADATDALVALCREGYWFTGSELQTVLDANRKALARLAAR